MPDAVPVKRKAGWNEIKGDFDRAKSFIDKINVRSRSAIPGEPCTIVTHPASTNHSKPAEEKRQAVEMTPGLIRIAVGLESSDVIISDVEKALEN